MKYLLLLSLLNIGCTNKITGPSNCHTEVLDKFESKTSNVINGRLVFITVIAPEVKTQVCE
jgi:hypothetical protein